MSEYLHQFDLAAAAVTEAQLRGAYEMGIAHGRSGQRIGDPRQGDITHWSGCDSIHPECRNEHESIRHDLTSILTDLIAQLRQIHQRQDGQSEADNHCWECGCIGECDPATTTATPCWPCATTLAADRAEARLREVTDE